jgi:hypothetical protein
MNSLRSPSVLRTRRLISAIRSFEPGGGLGLQNFSHSSSGARSAKSDEGITKGPGVTATIRPWKIEISQADRPISRRKVVVRNRPRRTSASSPLTRAISASIISSAFQCQFGPGSMSSPSAVYLHHGGNRLSVNRALDWRIRFRRQILAKLG